MRLRGDRRAAESGWNQIAPTHLDPELVSALLGRAAGRTVAPLTLDANQFRVVRSQRVLPLVSPDWDLPVNTDRLKQLQREAAISQLALENAQRQVLEEMGDLAADARVLKGLASRHLDYASPSLRESGDVDILIPPHVFPEVRRRLVNAGYSPKRAHPAKSFSKGEALISPNGHAIDLHTRLHVTGPSSSELFEAVPDSLPLGAFALPTKWRLLHAASHFTLTPPIFRRIQGLADIAAIRDRHDPCLESVREAASTLGVETMVGSALAIESQLSGRNSSEVNGWMRADWLERMAFHRNDRNILLEHLWTARSFPSVRQRAQYAASWAIPSREVLSGRGGARTYYAKLRNSQRRR